MTFFFANNTIFKTEFSKDFYGGRTLLKFVTGRLRSGKTTFIHNEIKNQIKSGKTGVTLIVPEQFSFATEKAMLKELGAADYANVSVLSFSRLADTVVSPAVLSGRELMSDSAQHAVMALALDSVKDKLTLYSKQTNAQGVIGSFLKVHSEMEQSAVTPGIIRETAEAMDNCLLKSKLLDVALACESYDAYRAQSYYDPADKLGYLYDELRENHYFKNKLVYIDGFRGFTALQMKIVGQMIIDADAVYISLCLDSPETGPEDELFGHTADTYRKLTALACRAGSPPVKPENESMGSKYNNFPPEIKRFKAPELAAYEMNIFDSCAPEYEEDASAITICKAPDIYTECELAASIIKKLIREEGYRCRDIAVVARDSEPYEKPMRAALRKCSIDIFEDFRRPLSASPVIAAVLAAIAIAAEGWQTENVMRFLRTGLSVLSSEEVNLLENYVFLWQTEGRKWLENWVSNPRGFGSKFTETEENELRIINDIRQKAVAPLEDFCEKVSEPCTAEHFAEAVYALLKKTGAPEKVRNYSQKLKEQGNTADSDSQGVYWDTLMSLLDSFVAAAGDVLLNAKDAQKLLSLMLNLETVGVIPAGLDEVTLGSADRIRLDSPKVVYILGANYGVFPAIKEETPPFTDKDRRILSEKGIELASFGEHKMKEERMIAYSAFCAAGEKLFISYSTGKSAGEDGSPSDVVERTRELFPNHRKIDYSSADALSFVESTQTAFEVLARQMPLNNELYKALRKYLEGKKEYSGRLEALDRAHSGVHFEIENKETAKELFGENPILSASRVEKYYKCPFEYFCIYGLETNANKRAEVDRLLRGTLSHYVLEQLLKKYKGDSLIHLTKEEILKEISKIIDGYLDEYMGGKEDKSERFMQSMQRLALSLSDVAGRLVEEFSVSEFRPVKFEFRIGSGSEKESIPYIIKDEEGTTVSITGSIDRVDTAEINGEKYLRVVDYKGGGKSFSLGETEFGVNMQMLIYLFAVWQSSGDVFGKITPAGVLYYQNSAKPVKLDRNADEKTIMACKTSEAKTDGIVLDSKNVVLAMDKENRKVFIPAKINEKTGMTEGSVISLQELVQLKKRVENKVLEMTRKLNDGVIDAYPFTVEDSGKEKTECEYCDYKAVCFLDNTTVKNRPAIKKRQDYLKELDREAQNNG